MEYKTHMRDGNITGCIKALMFITKTRKMSV